MKHSEILEKITSQIGLTPKQKDIANALGYDVGTINKRALRDSRYNREELSTLSKTFKVDLFDTNAIINQLMDCYIEGREKDTNTSIDYYSDVFGSCGGGAFVLSESKDKINVPKRIIKDFSSSKMYSVINAYGDSMTPSIQNKDLLIVEHTDGEQIKDNSVYVFTYQDKIYIKRLVDNVKQVLIKSDNVDYSTITLENEEINNLHIIGRIVGIMRVF